MTQNTFPDGFLWGVAGAGHQIEGNNSDSDTWFAENVSPTVFKEPSGIACDSYNRWEEDLAIVAEIGANTYRFSIEWARIQPTEDTFSETELAHYSAILDRCRQLGLKTIVTMNHFTSPHWFAKKASWLNPDSPQLFARYCAWVIERIGDRIDYVVTMNEPDLPRMLQWHNLPPFIAELERQTLEACSAKAGVERYRLSNVMLADEMDAFADMMAKAHTAAKAAMKAIRPDLPIGLSLAISDDQAVAGGTEVRDRKREEVYNPWLRLARADDFVGVQNYERCLFNADGLTHPEGDYTRNHMGGEVHPPSLANAVRYAHEVSGVPVLITEHGVSTDDDSIRAHFIEDSLGYLSETIADGVQVIGYTHWSILDNFEWIFGYEVHLGLVAVDRDTMVRTPKPSSAVFGKIAQANAV